MVVCVYRTDNGQWVSGSWWHLRGVRDRPSAKGHRAFPSPACAQRKRDPEGVRAGHLETNLFP